MSAYIVVRQGQAVHVVTDGAGYNHSGELKKVDSIKCLQLGSMPAVVTARGQHQVGWMIAQMGAAMAAGGWDFDDFLEQLPRQLLRLEDGLAQRHVPSEFEVILAGWSERLQGLAVFDWQAHDRYGLAEDQSRTLREISDPIVFAPVPDESYLMAIGFRVDRLEEFDVERHGLQLVEGQRRYRATESDVMGVGQFLVGGHAQLTTVTRETVTQKTLRTWDRDKVGGRIRPELVAVGAPPAVLTRQQRRALERQHSKGRQAVA